MSAAKKRPVSKAPSEAYDTGWDLAFGKGRKEAAPAPQPPINPYTLERYARFLWSVRDDLRELIQILPIDEDGDPVRIDKTAVFDGRLLALLDRVQNELNEVGDLVLLPH